MASPTRSAASSGARSAPYRAISPPTRSGHQRSTRARSMTCRSSLVPGVTGIAGGGTGALTGRILADLRKRFHRITGHTDVAHSERTATRRRLADMTTSTTTPDRVGSTLGTPTRGDARWAAPRAGAALVAGRDRGIRLARAPPRDGAVGGGRRGQELGSMAGALTSTGRLTGLVASALLLVQVFLMARVPWVEQAWGEDELARTHRLVGFTSFTLMLAHIVLITLGYAAGSPRGLWGTAVDLVVDYPGMLLAVAGAAALVMVVVTSVKRARRRLRYESWHLIHLYGYLGAGLALPHQLWTGADFLDSQAATVFWWGLYAVCAGSVLAFRLGSARAGGPWPLRSGVLDVTAEGTSATTVTVGGPGVGRMPVRAGQFLQWRFLDGPGWSRAHPVLALGRSGRPDVAHHRGARRRRVRPAGDPAAGHPGAGRGPVRPAPRGRPPGARCSSWGPASASPRCGPCWRTSSRRRATSPSCTACMRAAEAVLADELAALAAARGARYLLVEGPRVPGRASWLPAQARHLTDGEALRELVPDVADHDVYVCGADGWMTAVRDAALAAGVPRAAVHLERFAY